MKGPDQSGLFEVDLFEIVDEYCCRSSSKTHGNKILKVLTVKSSVVFITTAFPPQFLIIQCNESLWLI